ncbi:MAG: Acetyl-CoA:oxalate CoA-transferase [Burkholderia lata]|uniref:Acetyl-CoA:oxalate CoA-transferase n=1 Tax=Burkholderia lata (strain ATCC 17760 / DSM 23089 / LMG 22485 / NCIMB 9086 / R18194 / 383) TaxID=482957 RepID=A0A833Q0G9_BURL3|nr:CoA transferase [Burkholderia lata]KAF1041103.1 MAG: Acetyl-CoA:oxalate CoA-transferase [Burkholderia lata]
MRVDQMSRERAASGEDRVSRHLRTFWLAAGGAPAFLESCSFSGAGELVSAFRVTDLATAAIGAAGTSVAELLHASTGTLPAVRVDRRMASLWFGTSLRPQGWTMPPQWDPVAGNYRARDRWIRLHTNAPHHRLAALSVLDCAGDAQSVAQAVNRWDADALEHAIVERGGCAAAMYSAQEWAEHPQGKAVAAEPLLHVHAATDAVAHDWRPSKDRPLRGIRVLDLTRILAGPVATRFLAGLGADVLRIDPYGWEEPGTVPEVVLGKRCARLNLKDAADLDTLRQLLAGADIVVHGYRADALARLGLDAAHRRELNPALIDVSLDAYGWSGEWRCRRGFDSLIQTSTGIAEAGMRVMGRDEPVNLPVQAIDHATGYLMATAAIRGLTTRMKEGVGTEVRASLARTAADLQLRSEPMSEVVELVADGQHDRAEHVEPTSWGPASRLLPPVQIDDAPLRWFYPARALGAYEPEWLSSNGDL